MMALLFFFSFYISPSPPPFSSASSSSSSFSSSSNANSTGPRWLMPPEVPQPVDLLYDPGFGSSRLYGQEPPRLQRGERPLAGKGGTMGEKCPSNNKFHAI
jgi:hypothetical protein